MKFYGHIDLEKNRLKQSAFEIVTDFPLEPVVGQVCFKDTDLYVCISISSTPVWVKLSENIRAVVQSFVAQTTWTINHTFGTNVIVQTYDTLGKMLIPEDVDSSVDGVVTISFSNPQAGKAVVLAGGASEALGGGSGGVTDHGQLTGLGDDDHPQYALANGARGNFAASTHNHDAQYSAISHNHDATYAAISHAHTIPYDLFASNFDVLSSGEVMLRLKSARAFQLLGSGYGVAATAATASATFTISKNGSSIGTAVFAAGATTATITLSATSFAAGDVITIVGPATADATLANVDFTLLATTSSV